MRPWIIPRLCKYFIPWENIDRDVWEDERRWQCLTVHYLTCSQSFFTTFSSISSSSYWVVLTYLLIYAFIQPFVNWAFLPSLQFLTLIRSRRREDLNIQSSLISSLLSRSSRLPLVQCSVTMPNMPLSRNRPRNKFRFSWRMSLS